MDFSSPPQFASLLDSSAARHRMSIKPKNQRASAKNKRMVTSVGPLLNLLYKLLIIAFLKRNSIIIVVVTVQ